MGGSGGGFRGGRIDGIRRSGGDQGVGDRAGGIPGFSVVQWPPLPSPPPQGGRGPEVISILTREGGGARGYSLAICGGGGAGRLRRRRGSQKRPGRVDRRPYPSGERSAR